MEKERVEVGEKKELFFFNMLNLKLNIVIVPFFVRFFHYCYAFITTFFLSFSQSGLKCYLSVPWAIAQTEQNYYHGIKMKMF